MIDKGTGWSIVIAVIGFLITFIGIIWYELNKRYNNAQSAFVYILMISGVLILLIGLASITYFQIKQEP